MKLTVDNALAILSRTPDVLEVQLKRLPEEWLHGNEGPDSWTPQEVLAHLIVNEETNFIHRIVRICSEGDRQLLPVSMTDHFARSRQPLSALLAEFRTLRMQNLSTLHSHHLTDADFARTGIHPVLGEVRVANVLAAWVAHDLMHTSQITRTMAAQFRAEVGPFIRFLRRMQPG